MTCEDKYGGSIPLTRSCSLSPEPEETNPKTQIPILDAVEADDPKSRV
jgi:hypothetical protein